MSELDLHLDDRDIQRMASLNISAERIQSQISIFKRGIPPAKLSRPCILSDGILAIPDQKIAEYHSAFEAARQGGRILKFVPASGAATRMFKELLAYLTEASDSVAAYPGVERLMSNLQDFAFYNDLETALLKRGLRIDSLLKNGEYQPILDCLLNAEGLGYKDLPKGLIAFHRYGDSARTPFEEHLIEASTICADAGGCARVHFTISNSHEDKFIAEIERTRKLHQSDSLRFDISYSFQKPSTNTIAVDLENQPFRDENNILHFRPGGHGALLENLNDLDADIVFIKNIDNVVPDHLKHEIHHYQKLMAGLLLDLQSRIFEYLKRLTSKNVDVNLIAEICAFAENELGIQSLPEVTVEHVSAAKEALIAKLNRPLRVCGMVRNSGEQGGGPFWVESLDGTISCQIIEGAQIDKSDPAQLAILRASTHFNPVDIVCGLRNFRGEKFDLRNYTDPDSGFISTKSAGGRDIKALELPGLWNGSMAYWNTLFVEVPMSTFNPVKTIFDLLREQHQSNP